MVAHPTAPVPRVIRRTDVSESRWNVERTLRRSGRESEPSSWTTGTPCLERSREMMWRVLFHDEKIMLCGCLLGFTGQQLKRSLEWGGAYHLSENLCSSTSSNNYESFVDTPSSERDLGRSRGMALFSDTSPSFGEALQIGHATSKAPFSLWGRSCFPPCTLHRQCESTLEAVQP